MSTIKPDTTIGDKLMENFLKIYNGIFDDIKMQANKGTIIGLNNNLINKILTLVKISKDLDPPSNGTLQSELLENIGKSKKDKPEFSTFKKYFKDIPDTDMKKIETTYNDNDVPNLILSMNDVFFKNKTGPSCKISPSEDKYSQIFNNMEYKINFYYTEKNFLSFIGVIFEYIIKVNKNKKNERKNNDTLFKKLSDILENNYTRLLENLNALETFLSSKMFNYDNLTNLKINNVINDIKNINDKLNSHISMYNGDVDEETKFRVNINSKIKEVMDNVTDVGKDIPQIYNYIESINEKLHTVNEKIGELSQFSSEPQDDDQDEDHDNFPSTDRSPTDRSSTSHHGGTIYYKFRHFSSNFVPYYSPDGLKYRVEPIKTAVLFSAPRKKDLSCKLIIDSLIKDSNATYTLLGHEMKNYNTVLTANPCAGLTSTTPSNPATSTDCEDLMKKLGISEFKPRESTINAANWSAIQKSANLINLRSDPMDCVDVLKGTNVILVSGGSNYVMEGGDINTLRGLKDMKEAMPMPSFSGQVVDMAVKLLEGLRRSNVKVDDSIFNDIEAQITALKTQEKDVFEQLSKLKGIVDLSARVSGGEEHELSDLDNSTVDTLKDKLKEDIRRLLKRSECMQRLIVGASFGW
jgi:hypothetical protein